MTTHQVGILLTVLGTVLLAFSLRVRRQYEGEMARFIDKSKKEDSKMMEITETAINRYLFWSGLLCISVGSLMQW